MRLQRHPSSLLVFALSQAAGCAALTSAHTAFAQDADSSPVVSVSAEREQALATYLESHGQHDALAAYLRTRLSKLSVANDNAARVQLAEQLAQLYVRMLTDAQTRGTEADRRAIEQAATKLLQEVPQADSFELRLDLAKASYLPIEERAERARLRLLSEEDQATALRELRSSAEIFGQLAAKLTWRVSGLETQEKTAPSDQQDRLAGELADARQLRSLARYYEGWARHYVAMISGDKNEAVASITAFGALLNAVPGRLPSIDRFSVNSLKFEHVCRTVMGVAMGHAMVNSDVDALRWFELLESSQDVPASLHNQLFTRKLIVLAQTNRWADASVLVRARRAALAQANGSTKGVLDPLEARLVAVLALESLRSTGAARRETLDKLASELAQDALGDLIAQQQAGQVVDLVRKYGTMPLGETGFIVMYVKGTQAFEVAREKHREQESPAEKPTKLVAVINQYRDAAELLGSALASDDIARFPREQAPAALRRGLALYYAGDIAPAADVFEQAVALASSPQLRGDAMWFGIVALEALLAANPKDGTLAPRLDKLVTLYITEFPGSENATRLLLKQAGASDATDERTIEMLLSVPADSPLYEAARSQAARLLYRSFRAAPSANKEFAALRFADVAEDLLRRDQTRALADNVTTPEGEKDRKQAAELVALRVRQLAEVLLSAAVPDVQRVENALAMLDQAAFRNALDLTPMRDELAYRRMQIALARNDETKATLLADELRGRGGPFASAADALWLRRSVQRWQEYQESEELATSVVVVGTRALSSGTGNAAQVREWVASAAAKLWELKKDVAMRDKAIALDTQQHAAGTRTHASLRRLALMQEAAQNAQAAHDAWAEILASFQAPAPQWYEARLATIRLLIAIDPVKAKAALDQTKTLHSKPFPAPHDAALKEIESDLDDALRLLATKPPAPTGPAPTGPTSGGGGK
jgi:hypothetical protein